ncbi:MAG TPA: histidine triad nucleotide-binding protein [Candidatus Polarisedimenticolaceae bacterium]|nr:histidine triad nucleotide-binding protein [Candidatus Polarisedimenticolaceae bacterium]
MSCIFCRIVAEEVPAAFVHKDDEIVAFRDLSPQAPTHILIIPRRHMSSLNDAGAADALLLGKMLVAARGIAEREGIGAGYRVVANTGASAGQSVFHVHLHLLGGRPMAWPPG